MSDSPMTPQPGSNPADPPLTRAAARAGLPPVPERPVPPQGSAPTTSGEPAASAAEVPQPSALDEGTYTAIREPRRSGGLALDGTWHQISPKYVVSQFVQNAIFLVVVVAAAAAVWAFTDGQLWIWIVAGAIVLVTVASLVVLPRQARALGYMLRADDIVFRKGILWQRMVAVPYGRMQLVDITHGPMDRAFGISKLKMVTAAATTGVEIPGIGQQAAEALRDTLIDVAETRRTGL
ncbi:PH domain-containing protein [Microbacterium betulae]|uniref:PH domain-containing protein n=1 Tax=Microbacterium betulae TaxID=2981139 RepID=A0AA97I5A5_9MICO|nr:PH domain-containing protein [Microbacterium sp. AB]WOF22604.1 PH domain-containing protein [Microbacterium sp. AB]